MILFAHPLSRSHVHSTVPAPVLILCRHPRSVTQRPRPIQHDELKYERQYFSNSVRTPVISLHTDTQGVVSFRFGQSLTRNSSRRCTVRDTMDGSCPTTYLSVWTRSVSFFASSLLSGTYLLVFIYLLSFRRLPSLPTIQEQNVNDNHVVRRSDTTPRTPFCIEIIPFLFQFRGNSVSFTHDVR